MKNILAYLGSMFKGKDEAAPPPPTRATKIQAAYTALKAVGDANKYRLNFRSSDTQKVDTIAENIVVHCEILVRYIEILNDTGRFVFSDIVRVHGVRTLTQFMTQDGMYIPADEIKRFHALATLLVEHLYEYRDDQTGQGAHNIRQLGNCFVSIASVCDALVACKEQK